MREQCINDVIRRQMVGGCHPGIDEMQKSEIEKRKRNMESIIWTIYRISRREMSRSVFWFEKRTKIFARKIEKTAIFSNFEKRKQIS